MREVHIVYGSKGDYSDYYEWMVRAFTSKERAMEHARRCRERNGLLDDQEMSVRETPEYHEALEAIHAAPVRYGTHTWSEVNDYWRLPENKVLQDRYAAILDKARQVRLRDEEMNSLDPSYGKRDEYSSWPDDYEVVSVPLDEEG